MTRSITVRESEYSERDRAMLIRAWEEERAPRGSHGILLSEATNKDNAGLFYAEPIVDYAQFAVDNAREERRNQLGDPADDYPLLWEVKLAKPQDEG